MTDIRRSPARAGSGRGPDGPHLGVLPAISALLTVAGLAAIALLADGASVSPFAPTAQVASYIRANPDALRLGSLLLFGSGVPLGIFAAGAYTRLLRLGVRVPGPSIGFFGGIVASGFLMLSASVLWVLSRPEITTDAGLVHALAFLAFVTGGVGYATGMGLLVAGVAVPGLILRLLPRWLCVTGLVIAALCELSFVSMAIEPLEFLLPIGRFGGLAWLIAAGFLLPHTRAAANAARE